MDLNFKMKQAANLHAQGRLEESKTICLELLRDDPNLLPVLTLLGVIEVKLGNFEEALGCLTRAQRGDPNSFEAPFWASVASDKVGDLQEAIRFARISVAARPNFPQALLQLGVCLVRARELVEAEELLQQAVALAPTIPLVRANLSHCLELRGRQAEASAEIASLLASAPPRLEAYQQVAALLIGLEHWRGVLEVAEAGAKRFETDALDPSLVKAATELGYTDLAIEILKRRVASGPPDAGVEHALGSAYQVAGRLPEAVEHFRKSAELQPNQGYAYFGVVLNSPRNQDISPLTGQMESLLDEGKLELQEQSFLHYGLARAYENEGKYADSFKHYQSANQIERSRLFGDAPYDLSEIEAMTDRVRTAFDKAIRTKPPGFASEIPIVIAGMLRSGTTLLEQILSAHPVVAPAGEVRFWPDNLNECASADGIGFESAAFAGLGERYVNVLANGRAEAARVTDKMPDNWSILGAIHLALPKAKIVLMRRDPIDTCFSIFVTPNRNIAPYTGDLGALAQMYEIHAKLTDYWISKIPESSLMLVRYEDLVLKNEETIKTLVEFLGLEWSDALLDPTSRSGAVHTPSTWQARQPIYATSIGRWKHFEPWLGPLQKLGSGK